MTVKVILDTDIGSDIDDAVCLAYLLAQPECELLGITTVSGEPVERAMIASAICKVAGKNIPIYPGAEYPLTGEQRQPRAQQAARLPNWEHDTTFPTDQAISFLRDTIRANPGEVVLLAIGPMTNVAQLFQADPEIPGLLKALVLMCGRFTDIMASEIGYPVEWNAICDVDAAAIVYAAKPPVHRSIGLDVTVQVGMNMDEVRQRFDTRLLKPVRDFAEVWFEQHQRMVFHDPLAAVTIFDDVCTFTRGAVTVELADPEQRGRTDWTPDDTNALTEVATAVDAQRFFDHYFTTVTQA